MPFHYISSFIDPVPPNLFHGSQIGVRAGAFAWTRPHSHSEERKVSYGRTQESDSPGRGSQRRRASSAAHLGILRELLRHGICPDVLAGVSVGAIIAGYYAAVGMTVDELIDEA